MIERDRKEWIVITSDRQIMDHAWKNSSVPVPSDQFISRLEQSIRHNLPQPLLKPSTSGLGKEGSILSAYDTPGDYEQSDDEEDDDMQRKGSPRKRSKKEKALIRVLNKL